jgi:hypothetical protein
LFLRSPAAVRRPRASQSREVRADLFTAPQVRVHRFSYAGARIPDPAFNAAIATVERHLGRSITVIDHGEQSGGWGDHGPMAPIQDAGRAISAADVTAAGGTYKLATADAGILGVIDLRAIPGYEAAASGMLPLVEPGTIIVVELPGSEDGSGATGFAAAAAVEPGPTRCTGTVVLNRSAIHRRSNLFVSESKLGQWTLTHEIGHVLNVPASNSHIWPCPGPRRPLHAPRVRDVHRPRLARRGHGNAQGLADGLL